MNRARAALATELDERSRLIVGFFLVQVIGVIVLQKFALPTGAAPVELCLPLMLAGVAVLLARGVLTIDPIRLLTLGAFLLFCLASQLLSGVAMSGPSFLLMVALYILVVFRIDVSETLYLRCLNLFQQAMLVVFVIVLAQQAIQLVGSWRMWPNLDKLVPDALLLPGYNYLQPLRYASKFYKPHGIFFLEVSMVSQFAALAMIIEAACFRRVAHLACYALLLVVVFAGTGLLVLALTAPFLAAKLPRRALLGLVAGALVAAALAVATGWWGQISERLLEFQTPGTSGYYRFTVPFLTLMDRAGDPSSLLTGYGAGNWNPRDASILLPPVKVAFEYGFIPMFLFFLFFITSMLKAAPNIGIAVGFLMFYLWGGGSFAVPVYVVMCVLFGTLLRIDKPASAEAADSRIHRPFASLQQRPAS